MYRPIAFFLPFFFLFSLTKSISAQAALADFQPTPYIVYWGQMEAKLQWDEAQKHYLADLTVEPSDFRLSVQREPRLWDGKSILKDISLQLEGVAIEVKSENAAAYQSARYALDNLAVQADVDKKYALKMTMPDGQKAVISIGFEVAEVAPEDKQMWQKSGLSKASIWGEPLANLAEKTEFLAYSEFYEATRHWVQQMVNMPLTSDKTAYVSIVPPDGMAYEIELPRDMRTEEAQRFVFSKLSPKNIPPATQVFFQVRPNGAWVGDFLMFFVVKEDDPMRSKNKYDRRLFGIEWGYYRFELKGYYGAAISMADGEQFPVDGEYKYEEKNLDTASLIELLDLPFRIWEKGALLENLEYEMSIGSLQHKLHSDEQLPLLFKQQMVELLKQGEPLTIGNLKAEGMDLRKLSLVFSPKQ